MIKQIEIFTDGACRGNPGPGGWGVVLRYNHHEKLLKGAEAYTTNNRMELLAAIAGLSALKEPVRVKLTTDSKYLQDGIVKWLPQWKNRGWKTAGKKAVKNQDLWEKLDHLINIHHIEWHWVKAHAGHLENELADQLANQAIDEFLDKENI